MRYPTLMTTQHTAKRLTAAIAYWANCRGKGTKVQRKLVERTISELTARLATLS